MNILGAEYDWGHAAGCRLRGTARLRRVTADPGMGYVEPPLIFMWGRRGEGVVASVGREGPLPPKPQDMLVGEWPAGCPEWSAGAHCNPASRRWAVHDVHGSRDSVSAGLLLQRSFQPHKPVAGVRMRQFIEPDLLLQDGERCIAVGGVADGAGHAVVAPAYFGIIGQTPVLGLRDVDGMLAGDGRRRYAGRLLDGGVVEGQGGCFGVPIVLASTGFVVAAAAGRGRTPPGSSAKRV